MSLAGRVIFITGATAGFGAAMAELFISSGAKIIATGRRLERLNLLNSKVGSANLYTAVMDVRSEEDVAAVIANLPEGFKEVDTLINNAGLALGLDGLEKMSNSDIAQMIDTNINGVLHCTKELLPGMISRDKGHIVNLGSIAGNYPYPGGNVYGATKAFLKQFSLNLRADLLGKNIRVTNIEPGMCDTEFSTVRFHGDKQRADSVYAGMQPLTADDIAQTVLWCINRPTHVNVNQVEIMPVMQAFSPFAVARNKQND